MEMRDAMKMESKCSKADEMEDHDLGGADRS